MATKIPGAAPRARVEPLMGGASGVMHQMGEEEFPSVQQNCEIEEPKIGKPLSHVTPGFVPRLRGI